MVVTYSFDEIMQVYFVALGAILLAGSLTYFLMRSIVGRRG